MCLEKTTWGFSAVLGFCLADKIHQILFLTASAPRLITAA